MNPETLTEWRRDAQALIEANVDGTHVWAAGRIVALSEALEDMTREARLSREATDKAVRRLENLRNEIARLHDMYAVAPNEPRCCSDCAALDISDELRMVLRNA